ncbi:MAG TPA: ABC transporter ATP-binding protein [Actinomycetota bacterium]|nr:ABC transporter ATP-binding protein [Actinomycetota bacterium]
MTAVELADVSVAYDGIPALARLSLRIPSGAWIGLIGPNGAGKTTLLRGVAGLVSFAGEIRLGGIPVSSLSRRRLSQLVASLPHRPVIPESMPVSDYVLLGRTPYIPYLGFENRRDREVVGGVLERLELRELAARPLGSLSGGEIQRAVLGRALAQRAPVLLLDEPTAALDVGHQQQVLELIDEQRTEHGLTVVSAMHDLTQAGQFAERLLLLSRGRAVAEGPARDVLTESNIREHYGARVRVVDDPAGGVLVVPTRPVRLSKHVGEGARARGVDH